MLSSYAVAPRRPRSHAQFETGTKGCATKADRTNYPAYVAGAHPGTRFDHQHVASSGPQLAVRSTQNCPRTMRDAWAQHPAGRQP
jgi:hypothetical protein